MVKRLAELLRDEDGVTTVEYALLLATVTVASLGAWTRLGESIRSTVTDAAATLESAGSTTSAPGDLPKL